MYIVFCLHYQRTEFSLYKDVKKDDKKDVWFFSRSDKNILSVLITTMFRSSVNDADLL